MAEKFSSSCNKDSERQETGSAVNSGMPKKTKRNIRHLIAVGSGKGGVGKSTVSALLAVGLAKKGLKVGVLDADITGPSIPKLLGLREVPFSTDSGVVPPKTGWLGIRVMSINLMLDDPTKPVVWRGPLVGNVLRQFWEEVNWGDTEYLVIDLPPGTADAERLEHYVRDSVAENLAEALMARLPEEAKQKG